MATMQSTLEEANGIPRRRSIRRLTPDAAAISQLSQPCEAFEPEPRFTRTDNIESGWGSHVQTTQLEKRRTARARALAASSSQLLGGELVSSDLSRLLEAVVISSTAARN